LFTSERGAPAVLTPAFFMMRRAAFRAYDEVSTLLYFCLAVRAGLIYYPIFGFIFRQVYSPASLKGSSYPNSRYLSVLPFLNIKMSFTGSFISIRFEPDNFVYNSDFE